MTLESLIADAAAASVDGWDFSWLAGRATEERPSWGYCRTVVDRIPHATALLDIQTGGGEVFGEILDRATRTPETLAATEGWPPNFALARTRLDPAGVRVERADPHAELPFPAESFDLVLSRHPVKVRWDEVARVLKPGGSYLSQGIGPGANRELAATMTDVPARPLDLRDKQEAQTDATAAGLTVVDFQFEELRVTFHDVGAMVYFLRKVVWIVPDFTVEGYRSKLEAMHRRIERDGSFTSYTRRYWIEARKPE